MVEALRLDDLEIEMGLQLDHEENEKVEQISNTQFRVPVDEFLTLKTKIKNRSPKPVSPLLRLQPYLAGLPHNLALDLDKRLSWTGVLQVKLPIIPPGEAVESELGIVALCSGTFEIGATVDEAEIIEAKDGDKDGEGGVKGGRPRSNTQMLLQGGDVLGEPKLRSWHLREPCTIVAKRAR
jgi:hypothetical protein